MAKTALGAIGTALGSAATTAGTTAATAATTAATALSEAASSVVSALAPAAEGAATPAASAAGEVGAGMSSLAGGGAELAAPVASIPGEGMAGMTGITGATMEVPTGLTASMQPVIYSPGYSGVIGSAPATAFADSSVLGTMGASPLAATETPWWQTPMAKQSAGQMLQQGQKKLWESMEKPMPGAPQLRLGGQQPTMNIMPADRLAWLRAFKSQG